MQYPKLNRKKRKGAKISAAAQESNPIRQGFTQNIPPIKNSLRKGRCEYSQRPFLLSGKLKGLYPPGGW
jgi:hypothetical protein